MAYYIDLNKDYDYERKNRDKYVNEYEQDYYPNSKWKDKEPTCKDFGFDESEIDEIMSMRKKAESNEGFEYNNELLDALDKQKTKQTRARRAS